MTASVGTRTVGSSRSSTQMSPGARRMAPRMMISFAPTRSRFGDGLLARLFDVHATPPVASARKVGLMGVQARPPPGAQPRTGEAVDNRSDIRDFLAARRARITPEQVGLP